MDHVWFRMPDMVMTFSLLSSERRELDLSLGLVCEDVPVSWLTQRLFESERLYRGETITINKDINDMC